MSERLRTGVQGVHPSYVSLGIVLHGFALCGGVVAVAAMAAHSEYAP